MHLRIHESYRNVVSLCDTELLGKKFEEDKFQLDVRENFYKDKEVSKEKVIEILQKQKIEDSTFNIVGTESINAALEAEIITKEHIGEISGIPFALTLL